MKQFAFKILMITAMASGSLCFADTPATGFLGFCERALIDNGWITAPVHAQIRSSEKSVRTDGDLVVVTLPHQNNPIRYARTDRDIGDLVNIDPHYPKEFFKLATLQNKKILDVACGDGAMVEQLRGKNVDAIGLDIHLTPYQLSRSYFVRASAHDTGLASQSFDIIFSTQGPFTYMSHDRPFIQKLLNEMHRLLKPGGVLRISGLYFEGDFRQTGARPEIDLRNTAFSSLPSGLKIKSFPDKWWFLEKDPGEGGHKARYWLEFERVN